MIIFTMRIKRTVIRSQFSTARSYTFHLPMMIMSNTTPITPIMIIIFKLAHQCLRFSLPACCSNCDAPCWSASARWSSSESFWSLSSTFSTFTRIMPTTSSTCFWVSFNRLLSDPPDPEDPCWLLTPPFPVAVLLHRSFTWLLGITYIVPFVLTNCQVCSFWAMINKLPKNKQKMTNTLKIL